MLDKNVLEKIILNIETINALCKEYGFEEVSIFKPLSIKDAKRINLVANQVNEDSAIDLFSIVRLQEKLRELLSCKVDFLPKSRINEDFKKFILEDANQVCLIGENIERIKEFFNRYLMVDPRPYNLFSQKGIDENKEIVDSQTLLSNNPVNNNLVESKLKDENTVSTVEEESLKRKPEYNIEKEVKKPKVSYWRDEESTKKFREDIKFKLKEQALNFIKSDEFILAYVSSHLEILDEVVAGLKNELKNISIEKNTSEFKI